jgi:hypothetical protein
MDSYETLYSVFYYAQKLGVLCLGINIVLFLVRRKKLNTSFLRILYFLSWNFLIEILAILFIEFEINNLPLLHLYTLGEFILFSYFYLSLSNTSSRIRKTAWYFIGGGALFIILNTVFIQGVFEFNTIAKTFVQIVIIAYAVLYFYHLVANASFSEATSKSIRLVNSAIIIYYSGSLFIFMFSHFSIGKEEVFILFWIFNVLLYFIFQLLIFIALWNAFYKKTRLPQ